MLIIVFKVIFVQFQVISVKVAKRSNLEHSRAFLGQDWIVQAWRLEDGRIWRLEGLESAKKDGELNFKF